MDPMEMKYMPYGGARNALSPYQQRYLEKKRDGVYKIDFLVDTFGLSKMILYKAICLMDQIFLNNEVSPENIELISSICVFIAVKFCLGCSQNKNEFDNFHSYFGEKKKNKKINDTIGLFHYIKKNIKHLTYWEALCLKYLNYDLGKYSAYDYLILFFRLGIFFCKEKISVKNELMFCFNILNYIIYYSKSCKYSQYIIGMSIIKVAFENHNIFNKDIFKSIYGVDLSKKKYINCSNMIKFILNKAYNMYYHLNSFYTPNIINNRYNSNNDKKATLYYFLKDINDESNNDNDFFKFNYGNYCQQFIQDSDIHKLNNNNIVINSNLIPSTINSNNCNYFFYYSFRNNVNTIFNRSNNIKTETFINK
jgi:hypothetical protein